MYFYVEKILLVLIGVYLKGFGKTTRLNWKKGSCKMKDLKILLAKLGFTKGESTLIAKLCELGFADIKTLIKKCEMHKATVYDVINRLMQEGVICITVMNGKNYYSLNESAFFGRIIKERNDLEKKKELAILVEKYKQEIEKVRRDFSQSENIINKTSGKRAFKGFFVDLLKTTRSNDENYFFIGDGGEMRDVMGAEYYRFSQELKKVLKIGSTIILNEIKKDHPFSKEVYGRIKWAPKDLRFPVNIFIYDNKSKVMIVDWSNGIPKLVQINSKNIALTHLKFFKYLWTNRALKLYERLSTA